jgi:hypothetical protein
MTRQLLRTFLTHDKMLRTKSHLCKEARPQLWSCASVVMMKVLLEVVFGKVVDCSFDLNIFNMQNELFYVLSSSYVILFM